MIAQFGIWTIYCQTVGFFWGRYEKYTQTLVHSENIVCVLQGRHILMPPSPKPPLTSIQLCLHQNFPCTYTHKHIHTHTVTVKFVFQSTTWLWCKWTDYCVVVEVEDHFQKMCNWFNVQHKNTDRPTTVTSELLWVGMWIILGMSLFLEPMQM